MNEDQLSDLAETVNYLEELLNDEVIAAIEEHDIGFAVNLMLNISTTLMAKALLMTDQTARSEVERIALLTVTLKMKEGQAAIDTHKLMEKAKAH